jgi:hypothetical protein
MEIMINLIRAHQDKEALEFFLINSKLPGLYNGPRSFNFAKESLEQLIEDYKIKNFNNGFDCIKNK